MLGDFITSVVRMVLSRFRGASDAVNAVATDTLGCLSLRFCERRPVRLKSVVLTSGIIVFQVVS